MKQNKISIIIDRPVDEVFAFTTNPENTHLWIPSVVKEISEKYPPEIGTKYQNKGEGDEWDFYKVTELSTNEIFTLSDLEGNYFVRYTYRPLENRQTKLEYFEWVENGEIQNPFTPEILENLKRAIEKK